jgi:hypothetical protein
VRVCGGSRDLEGLELGGVVPPALLLALGGSSSPLSSLSLGGGHLGNCSSKQETAQHGHMVGLQETIAWPQHVLGHAWGPSMPCRTLALPFYIQQRQLDACNLHVSHTCSSCEQRSCGRHAVQDGG